jgi:hypothetical protein
MSVSPSPIKATINQKIERMLEVISLFGVVNWLVVVFAHDCPLIAHGQCCSSFHVMSLGMIYSFIL